VFKLSYPHQPALADWGRGSLAAQQSFFAMPPPLFYELHPFHLVCDTSLRLLQWGAAVGRVVPELQNGRLLHECFRVRRMGGPEQMGAQDAFAMPSIPHTRAAAVT
jgi:hypothetical protein